MKSILFSLLYINSYSLYADSMAPFALAMSGENGVRYEVKGEVSCSDGSPVSLSGYFQYSKDSTSGQLSLIPVKASQYAPYLWFLKDHKNSSAHIAFYSDLLAEYIFCDDDGDEFQRKIIYSYFAIYNLSGDIKSPAIDLRNYVRIPGSSTGWQLLDQSTSYEENLVEDMIWSDPRIDGPAEVSVRKSSIQPKLSFEQINEKEFFVTFEKGCGGKTPLKVKYQKSACRDDGYWCSGTPEDLVY